VRVDDALSCASSSFKVDAAAKDTWVLHHG
jgi:hypothetical protein